MTEELAKLDCSTLIFDYFMLIVEHLTRIIIFQVECALIKSQKCNKYVSGKHRSNIQIPAIISCFLTAEYVCGNYRLVIMNFSGKLP